MKQNKAKKIILVLLAVICAAVLVYSLYQGLIIYIPQKQEQHRFSELQQIAEQENREEKDRTEPSQGDNGRPQNESSSTSAGEAGQQLHFDDIAKINSDFRGWLRIETPNTIFTAILTRTIPFREHRSSVLELMKIQTRLLSMPTR